MSAAYDFQKWFILVTHIDVKILNILPRGTQYHMKWYKLFLDITVLFLFLDASARRMNLWSKCDGKVEIGSSLLIR